MSRHSGRPPFTDGWGIVTRHQDALGAWHRVPEATIDQLRRAMGKGAEGDLVRPWVRVVPAGSAGGLERGRVRLETGEWIEARPDTPLELPPGIHAVHGRGGGLEGWWLATPGACAPPAPGQRWGWATQLYALRSRRSWGMGDLEDLRAFGQWTRKAFGTDFTLVNPLGASLPCAPQEPSPYFPSSRLYLNPLYLRVDRLRGVRTDGAGLEALDQAGRDLNRQRLVDRDAVWALKSRALERLWRRFGGDPRWDRFRREQGRLLEQFGVFNALAEAFGTGWRTWPARFRRPDHPAVARFAAEHADRVVFHQWLQWQLDEQLAVAARALPLMLDVPIGVRPDGFDAWLWQDLMALDVSVGAPPDGFNPLGQNWGLPAFIPSRLRAAGYEPWRLTLRAMLRHARSLRIDHVMGLFRLYWIPEHQPPERGAFVRYPAEELLAVLAMESQRTGALIIGEDLGTVEPGVRRALRRQNILSYRLLWFERTTPERYPRQALAALTTHDLFTVAGLWSGKDVEAQRSLGLKPNVEGTRRIRRRLARWTGLQPDAPIGAVLPAAHAALRRAPCALLTATLEDALGVEARPNMPGTTDSWPNWRSALPRTLEEMRRTRSVRQVAQAMAGRSKG